MPGPFSPADPAHYLGVGFQTVKGTGVAPTLFVPYQGALEFEHGVTFQPIREGGAGFSVQRSVKGNYAPGGRAVTAIRPSTAGQLMAALLGVDTISGASDPWTHTIGPDAQMDWLSIERNVGDEQIERIVDGFVTEALIDIRKRDSDAEARIEFTFAGLNLDRQAAATSITLEATLPFIRSAATWTVDGAGATNVESSQIRIRWRYDTTMLADSVVLVDAIKLDLDVEVTLNQIYNTSAEVDAYRATHYGAIAGTAPSDTVLEGDLTIDFNRVDAANRRFQCDIPDLVWENATLTPPDPAGNEGTRLTRTGRAKNTTPANVVGIIVENADNAAYV